MLLGDTTFTLTHAELRWSVSNHSLNSSSSYENSAVNTYLRMCTYLFTRKLRANYQQCKNMSNPHSERYNSLIKKSGTRPSFDPFYFERLLDRSLFRTLSTKDSQPATVYLLDDVWSIILLEKKKRKRAFTGESSFERGHSKEKYAATFQLYGEALEARSILEKRYGSIVVEVVRWTELFIYKQNTAIIINSIIIINSNSSIWTGISKCN